MSGCQSYRLIWNRPDHFVMMIWDYRYAFIRWEFQMVNGFDATNGAHSINGIEWIFCLRASSAIKIQWRHFQCQRLHDFRWINELIARFSSSSSFELAFSVFSRWYFPSISIVIVHLPLILRKCIFFERNWAKIHTQIEFERTICIKTAW